MITRSALFALILLVTSFSAPKVLVDAFTFSFMNTMGTPPGTLPDKLYSGRRIQRGGGNSVLCDRFSSIALFWTTNVTGRQKRLCDLRVNEYTAVSTRANEQRAGGRLRDHRVGAFDLAIAAEMHGLRAQRCRTPIARFAKLSRSAITVIM
jgi:hypothetical protein